MHLRGNVVISRVGETEGKAIKVFSSTGSGAEDLLCYGDGWNLKKTEEKALRKVSELLSAVADKESSTHPPGPDCAVPDNDEGSPSLHIIDFAL